ncbi:MAG: hypothetical protein LBJ08_04150 [Bifidobacteriaceae bacterium]|nr:hypothetical protein [Bifidobacteriaceae bacterium]
MIRYRLDDGGHSDAVGALLASSRTAVTVATRRGQVAVPAAKIAIAKLISLPQGS